MEIIFFKNIVEVFVLLLITQMLSYGIMDHFKIKYGRFIILSIFLSIFLIVLPIYFHLPAETTFQNCCECYNPFGYFKEYWNIGIIQVLSAHFTYCYLLSRKQKIIKQ